MPVKEMCKVVRLQLNYLYDDDRKQKYPYDELHTLQRLVSKAKNRTIQACWEWNNFEVAFKNENGVLPDKKEYMDGMSQDGYVNRILKGEFYQMYSQNLTCAIRSASKAFKDAKFEMQNGMRSVLSYRADCPVEVHNQRITLHQEKQKYYVSLNLFSKVYVEEKGYSGTYMDFEL